MKKTMPAALLGSIIGSGVLHVALVIALVVTTTGTSHSGPVQTVITTKIVRLGKERKKELLPRLPSAPPPAPKVAHVGEPDPKAKPVPKPKSAKDRMKEMDSLSSALGRLKDKFSDEDPEGHPDGSPDGEVTNLAHALAGNRYATEIYSCVKKHYSIEGLPPERVRDRRAIVFVRVNSDGSFFDAKIEKSSKLKAFDRLVIAAIKRCRKVSPPPKEIADQVRKDGIEFEFTL